VYKLKEITNKEFWELYKKIGGNTDRNIAHLRTLIEEITSKQKVRNRIFPYQNL